MEQDIHTFKPQWLQGTVRATGAMNLSATGSPRSDYQSMGGSSRNHSSRQNHDHFRQPSSRRSSGSTGSRRPDRDGMGKSRGYANFGRNRDRDFDSRDRESRSVAADRDCFKSFRTCRSESDRMNCARSKADTWIKGVVNLNNGSTSNADVSASRSNDVSESSTVLTTKTNTVSISFEREFPQLSLDDKNGRQGISKAPSPGISTAIQNVPLTIASDGWNSVLAEPPLLSDSKKSLATSSELQIVPIKQTEVVANSGTALSMAETVMQAPLRVSVGPQLSTEAQKIEERTLRQHTLRPRTPTSNKTSVLNSSKPKGTRIGDPTGLNVKTAQQLKIQSANGSIRAPVKNDITKFSQSGTFQVLSRGQNVSAQSAKDYPTKPVSSPTLVSTEPQKPVVTQKFKIAHEHPLPLQGPSSDKKSNARDKHMFFEMLRTKSSNGPGMALESGRQMSPSSEPVDTGDEGFQSSLSDSTEGSSSSTPADSDDGWNRSQSSNEDASSLLEITELGDEDHPTDLTPEDKRFMMLLGWREDEMLQVEPLDFEEIADTVKGCEELKKKLQSMESNDNIKSILLHIYGQK